MNMDCIENLEGLLHRIYIQLELAGKFGSDNVW